MLYEGKADLEEILENGDAKIELKERESDLETVLGKGRRKSDSKGKGD